MLFYIISTDKYSDRFNFVRHDTIFLPSHCHFLIHENTPHTVCVYAENFMTSVHKITHIFTYIGQSLIGLYPKGRYVTFA